MTPQCAAVKRDGSRCRGRAQKGFDKCGPHLGLTNSQKRTARRLFGGSRRKQASASQPKIYQASPDDFLRLGKRTKGLNQQDH